MKCLTSGVLFFFGSSKLRADPVNSRSDRAELELLLKNPKAVRTLADVGVDASRLLKSAGFCWGRSQPEAARASVEGGGMFQRRISPCSPIPI